MPEAKDKDWLTSVGRRGWVVLTKDDRIRYRATEWAALKKAGVKTFVLTSGQLQGKEMAEAFIKALPKMKRLPIRRQGFVIAKVMRSGTVSVLELD